MATAAPAQARRHYLWSALLTQRAIREARAAHGVHAAALVVANHQIVAATAAQPATRQILDEQGIDQKAQGVLNPVAFTTDTGMFAAMADQTKTDFEFDRLVAGLVADAGRAADQVATALTPEVGYVRYLSPPSCGRCAVLSGRVYRFSTGFQRHPGCDCTMVPTSLSNPAFHHDPLDLARQGLVQGLSKADAKAIATGADVSQVVNIRRSSAGLSVAGQVLVRRGRPTPEGIYQAATSRDDAIQRLIAAGYAHP